MSGYLNPATGRAEPAEGVDGAVQVRPVAAVGSQFSYPLDANAAAGSGDGATEHISNSTGWKLVKPVLINPVTIGDGAALIVAWSTSANAEVALALILDAYRTALGTPDAAGYPNVRAYSTPADMPAIEWDGITTIKTVSVATVSTDRNIALATVA